MVQQQQWYNLHSGLLAFHKGKLSGKRKVLSPSKCFNTTFTAGEIEQQLKGFIQKIATSRCIEWAYRTFP